MKNILVSIFTLLSVITSAQILDPVSWSFTQQQLSDNEIELFLLESFERKFSAILDSMSEIISPSLSIFEKYNLIDSKYLFSKSYASSSTLKTVPAIFILLLTLCIK